VVAESYNGMVINPAHKINTADQMFGKNLKVELGNPKLVSSSWKSASDSAETKDGE
jgi:hypothetical protein